MARKQYNEDEVLKSLRKKNDCRISGQTIMILSDEIFSREQGINIPNLRKIGDLGNSTYGRIDYLVNYCGYSVVKVGEF